MLNNQEEIMCEELPKGKYFFHSTDVSRLESIQKIGLTTPEKHKFEKNWDISFYHRINNRLFLFPNEKDCLMYTIKRSEYRSMKVLRFRREVIKGERIYNDREGYSESFHSIYINATIPADEIEACEKCVFDKIEGYKGLCWVSISEAQQFQTKDQTKI